MSTELKKLTAVCLDCKRLNKKAYKTFYCFKRPDCPATKWTFEIKTRVMSQKEKI